MQHSLPALNEQRGSGSGIAIRTRAARGRRVVTLGLSRLGTIVAECFTRADVFISLWHSLIAGVGGFPLIRRARKRSLLAGQSCR